MKKFDPRKDKIESLPQVKGYYLVVLRSEKSLDFLFNDVELLAYETSPIVYSGITFKSLRKRYLEHFLGNAKKSTLRKSLGTLLNYNSFREYLEDDKYTFDEEHEKNLTQIMKDNLIFYYFETEEDLEKVEDEMISLLNPPLNLKGNNNEINKTFREDLELRRK
jgi:predicted GIY-YIG superfamily endonuclease